MSVSMNALPGAGARPAVLAALRDGLRGLEPARPSLWRDLPPAPGALRRAAVLVPIVPTADPFVLLTRRSPLLRHHPGQVSFPGGRADPEDEDAVATALREAHEEIGLDPGLVEVVGRLPEQQASSRHLITPVVALLSPLASWTAAEGEVAAIFGLELSRLLEAPGSSSRSVRRVLSGPRAGTWCWPHDEHDIWGATAAILVSLSRHLRGTVSGLVDAPGSRSASAS